MRSVLVFELKNILCFVLTPVFPQEIDEIQQYFLKLKYKDGMEICYSDLYFDKETYTKTLKDIEEQIYL